MAFGTLKRQVHVAASPEVVFEVVSRPEMSPEHEPQRGPPSTWDARLLRIKRLAETIERANTTEGTTPQKGQNNG